RLARCVQELQSHAGNRERQLVSAERAGRRQVAFTSGWSDPPELHLDAAVDVQRVRQRHAELVAAIAPGAADVRRGFEKAPVAVVPGMVVAGKDARARGVVGVRVGIDDRAHRRAEEIPQRRPDGARVDRVAGRIDDDRPAVALDQDHVACRVTDGHVHAVGHPDHVLAELVRLRAQLLAPGIILSSGSPARGEERRTSQYRCPTRKKLHLSPPFIRLQNKTWMITTERGRDPWLTNTATSPTWSATSRQVSRTTSRSVAPKRGSRSSRPTAAASRPEPRKSPTPLPPAFTVSTRGRASKDPTPTSCTSPARDSTSRCASR